MQTIVIVRGLPGSGKTAIARAIAAIKLLQKTTPLSDAERGVLMEFPGGGILKECGVFTDSDTPQWLKEGREELRSLLTDEEWASLQNAGMQNAHYTAPSIRRVMWEAIAPFLKEHDSVLDPGCGIAGFYQEMPKHLKYTGVEKEEISATIAKRYIHTQSSPRGFSPVADFAQSATSRVYHRDFLKWSQPESFNLAIGNVPFTNGVSICLLDGKQLRIGLHAQFFVRAIANLAPGGLLAFLTSCSTLDSRTPDYLEFRHWVDSKCEFLGAVRLPSEGTHCGATEVTTDLILLRRREQDYLGEVHDWVGSYASHLQNYRGDPVYLSNWYLNNPQYLIGEPVCGQLRGKNGNPATNFALLRKPNQDVLFELRLLLNSLLDPAYYAGNQPNPPELNQQEVIEMATVIPADKFTSNSVYAFILRENPAKKGIEIHFAPDCATDTENAIAFIAKVVGAGFKQANKNPKLYYASYSEALIARARSWTASCKPNGAQELSPDEPVESTPSRRRYGSKSADFAQSSPRGESPVADFAQSSPRGFSPVADFAPTAAPNKLLDAIALLLNSKIDPLAEDIASVICSRLKSERGSSQEVESLKAANEKLTNDLVMLSRELHNTKIDAISQSELKAERDAIAATLEQIQVTTLRSHSELKAERDNLVATLEQTQANFRALFLECDELKSKNSEYVRQLEELGMLEVQETTPTFADDKPVFTDESEEPSPMFADESEKPSFDDEEEGFDLNELEGK